MKNFSLLLFPIIGLTVLLSFPSSTKVNAQDSKSSWSGPSWEYKVIYYDDRPQSGTSGTRARSSASESKLNTLGKEGWELVSVRTGSGSEAVFYFKRKKP